MSSLITLLPLLLLLLLAILLRIYAKEKATERIHQYLSERGATDINIENSSFDFDRSNMTFSITYTGISGNQHMTLCKLRNSILPDDEFFWTSLTDLKDAPAEITYSGNAKNDGTVNSKFSEKIKSRSTSELPTYNIAKVLPIPGSHDQIVMLDYTRSFQNVLRCKMNGQIFWQAELPTTSGDAYTNIEWEGQNLTAFSKSCIAVVLDMETGKIISEK